MRRAGVAGYFYPSEPTELQETIQHNLSRAKPPRTGEKIRGLVVPHAGYQYSGQTAAKGYAQLKESLYDGIILLGPNHRAPLELGSVLREDAYETPLGRIPLRLELAQKIEAAEPQLAYQPSVFNSEHSLEVHLPFIQMIFQSPPPVLPMLIGARDMTAMQHIARVILDALAGQSNYLVIASSDLSHFYPAETAERLDRHSLDVITQQAPEKLGQELAAGTAEMCGFGPILVMQLLMAAWNVTHSTVIDYSHSGQTGGDNHRVVGYGAVAFF